jgi:5-methylthioadenosine/S-adenosylhomocysteine deaminase
MTGIRYFVEVLVTCDENFTVIRDAVIDVKDGQITWVGKEKEAPTTSKKEIRINGLVMPGLINTHAHTPMTLLRGGGDGLPLMRWLTEVMWPREGLMTPSDAYWGMTLGSAEMLSSGITTTCEMYIHEEQLVEAATNAGIRIVMTPGILSVLHADSNQSAILRIDEIADFHRLYNNPEKGVTVGFGPHSAYDLGASICAEVATAARDLGALLHIHIAETANEGSELERLHEGLSTVRILGESGVFGGKVLAAHSVWLTREDLASYADYGVAVAHCPLSNMKLGSGVADIKAMRELGITVALGTDGPASNDSLDLWQEIKIAPLLSRVSSLDSTTLDAKDAICMATRDGAKALGLADVGSLEVGHWADMIRLDLDDSAFIPATKESELISSIAFAAGRRLVSDVWVKGEKVVSGHECLTVDENLARTQCKARGLRLAQESGT